MSDISIFRLFRAMNKAIQADNDDPLLRNIQCNYTEKVMDYLYSEWSVDAGCLSVDLAHSVMDTIEACRYLELAVPVAANEVMFLFWAVGLYPTDTN
jgi:hypothetical protein